ncbi:MAG: TIR domain-containing protein [Desulfobulbaceae bacterium]|nr:TIR domain-containing protein [Desulfobulbaceae bacterium]
MAGVFISYRRKDSDVAAGRLADDLSEIFGRDSIFRDVDTLEVGEDYENALDHALELCAALIVVIGPRWSTISDDAGRRRLEAGYA